MRELLKLHTFSMHIIFVPLSVISVINDVTFKPGGARVLMTTTREIKSVHYSQA